MAEPVAAGLVLVDKPAGISSFKALAALRPVYGRKLGHAGTLDPFATGLLLVLTGRATRLVDHLAGTDKEYEAEIRFGATSTTDDPEGEITITGATTDAAALRATLPRFIGQIQQVPPAASAVHVDGERAYRRFRRGEAVTVPARSVTVYDLDLRSFDPATQSAHVRVRCGTGTYVRSIARDLGEALGCGAHLTALRRTRIGPFSVEESAAPGAIGAAPPGRLAFRPAADVVADLPRRIVTAREATDVSHGRSLVGHERGGVALLDAEDRLLAIADGDGDRLYPRIVLEPA